MTEHFYYECDVCGRTANKFNNTKGARRVRDMADFLLDNTRVKHVCMGCINEVLVAAREAVKKRYGVNKSKEDQQNVKDDKD